jgi:hypothetical protein
MVFFCHFEEAQRLRNLNVVQDFSPAKCYSAGYVRSEDYGLEERAASSNMRRLE